jgi:HEAT repeat protein
VQGLNRARSLGAQEALARALVAEAANERGSRIASELGFQPDPLPIVAGALDRVAAGATTASESAELALGSVAFTLLPTDPSLARGVAQRIAARFLSPAYAYRRRSEMLALGNSGNPAVLDLVMRTTQDHDPFLRSAATLALRRQTGTTAEERLRASLGGEDSAVRLSAAIAYTQRPVDANAYAALETAFRYETSPTVRSKELEAILDARDRQPDAIAFVEDVAAHDRDKDVRRNAKRALAGLPPPPPDNEAALASVETQTH